VLEIGSLGGYSGVWLARALPPGGELTTMKKTQARENSRDSFDLARLHGRVQLIEGSALDVLPRLPHGFDAVSSTPIRNRSPSISSGA